MSGIGACRSRSSPGIVNPTSVTLSVETSSAVCDRLKSPYRASSNRTLTRVSSGRLGWIPRPCASISPARTTGGRFGAKGERLTRSICTAASYTSSSISYDARSDALLPWYAASPVTSTFIRARSICVARRSACAPNPADRTCRPLLVIRLRSKSTRASP